MFISRCCESYVLLDRNGGIYKCDLCGEICETKNIDKMHGRGWIPDSLTDDDVEENSFEKNGEINYNRWDYFRVGCEK